MLEEEQEEKVKKVVYDSDYVNYHIDKTGKELFKVLKGQDRKTYKELFSSVSSSDQKNFTSYIEKQNGKEFKELQNLIKSAKEIANKRSNQSFFGSIWNELFSPTYRKNPFETAILEKNYNECNWFTKSISFIGNAFITAVSAPVQTVVSASVGICSLPVIANNFPKLKENLKNFSEYISEGLRYPVECILKADGLTGLLDGIASFSGKAVVGTALAGITAGAVAMVAKGVMSAGILGGLTSFAGFGFSGALGIGAYHLLKRFGFSPFYSISGGVLVTIVLMYATHKILQNYYQKRKEEKRQIQIAKNRVPQGKKMKQDKIGRYFVNKKKQKEYVQIF